MGFDPQVTGDPVAETHMDLGLVLVLSNTHGFGSESPMSRLVMVPISKLERLEQQAGTPNSLRRLMCLE